MADRLRQIAVAAGGSVAALALANPAGALTILPTFTSSITKASNASAIEGAIDAAVSAIEGGFSNAFSVPILFEAVHDGTNGFLAASESTFYSSSYSYYVSLLKSASAANPANTVLSTAVANLGYGNKGGADGIVATNTVFDALGLSLPGGFNASGNFVGTGAYDGVILINIDQPLDYKQPLPAYNGKNLQYDATRTIEHEIDEVLGGGGSGSTLNDVADYGLNNPSDVFTYYEGALDLYRYSGLHKPSFSTGYSTSVYFSVDGGKTDIVGFNNQYPQGDMGDFGPTVYACSGGGLGGPPGLIQDAFNCPNQTGEAFTSASPEYAMLEALGYDPAGSGSSSLSSSLSSEGGGVNEVGPGGDSFPEPSTWVMILLGFASLAVASRSRPQSWLPHARR